MEDYELEIIDEMREKGYEGTDSELLHIRAEEFNQSMRELGFDGEDLIVME